MAVAGRPAPIDELSVVEQVVGDSTAPTSQRFEYVVADTGESISNTQNGCGLDASTDLTGPRP